MKKLISLLCGIVGIFMMTSCWDDDTERSYHLSGAWEGRFGAYYEYQNRRGDYIQVDSYLAELEFLPAYDYATHGTGHEVDYYDRGPYDYQYYYFNWDIDNGVIYMTFPHAHEMDVELYDYRMSSDRITGYINSNTPIKLSKYKDYYYGWHEDYIRYGCDDYDWWYSHGCVSWSWKPDKSEVPTDSDIDTRAAGASEAEQVLPEITRVGRHI